MFQPIENTYYFNCYHNFCRELMSRPVELNSDPRTYGMNKKGRNKQRRKQ